MFPILLVNVKTVSLLLELVGMSLQTVFVTSKSNALEVQNGRERLRAVKIGIIMCLIIFGQRYVQSTIISSHL